MHNLLNTLYHDTALCGNSPSSDLTAAFVPEDKLVIGSDHPYCPPQAMLALAKAVEERKCSEEQRKRLYVGNAAIL